MGQLDKRTQQQDVASLLEEFGQIESINVSGYSQSFMLTKLSYYMGSICPQSNANGGVVLLRKLAVILAFYF